METVNLAHGQARMPGTCTIAEIRPISHIVGALRLEEKSYGTINVLFLLICKLKDKQIESL